MIPFKLLILASDALQNLGAEEELRMSHANAYGSALAMGDKEQMAKLKRHIRKLTRTAHPEVPINGT